TGAPPPKRCREDFLGGGFPHGAGNTRDFPAPGFAYRTGKLLERDESVIDNDALRANRVRKLAHFSRGHRGGESATFECAGHMIVSIVARSVDGNKQFASSNGARINRDAGQ